MARLCTLHRQVLERRHTALLVTLVVALAARPLLGDGATQVDELLATEMSCWLSGRGAASSG